MLLRQKSGEYVTVLILKEAALALVLWAEVERWQGRLSVRSWASPAIHVRSSRLKVSLAVQGVL